MNFQFLTPTRIIAGQGCFEGLGGEASALSKKAFVFCSSSMEKFGWLKRAQASLKAAGVASQTLVKTPGEPTVEMTDAAAAALRESRAEVVISIGGGSVIDLAKAAAGLAVNPGSVKDYLEGVGKGLTPSKTALPHIAVPATAGAGAEVTRNAVIACRKERFKKSFRSPTLYPRLALLDPELTASLPPRQTAFSGMDAITQLIESHLCVKSTPFTDALALHGLSLAMASIERAFDDGADMEARENMLIASTISGVCLANAGLGMAHGFASGLGAMYDVPHGKVCAILLPFALRFNRCARFPRMVEIARRIVPGERLPGNEQVDAAMKRIDELNKKFGIPKNLAEFNIQDADLPGIAEKSMGNSMSGNPSPVTPSIAQTLLKSMK
ncbi:MAG: iron-containing alcohol dehydrogenase [bacterium]|nr:iron-containing alcohol dehydrogenase [bacterium]